PTRRSSDLPRRHGTRVASRAALGLQLSAGAAVENSIEKGKRTQGSVRLHSLQIPSSCHSASTRAFTSGVIVIGRPHSRLVSPGSFDVASKPIFEPSPETGEAKSR